MDTSNNSAGLLGSFYRTVICNAGDPCQSAFPAIYFNADDPSTYELDERGGVKSLGVTPDGGFGFTQSDPAKRPRMTDSGLHFC